MNTSLSPSPNVVATSLDDQDTVLLNLTTRKYYTLNETATRIWELMTEETPLPKIASVLASEWDIDLESTQQHVQDMVKALEAEGLMS